MLHINTFGANIIIQNNLKLFNVLEAKIKVTRWGYYILPLLKSHHAWCHLCKFILSIFFRFPSGLFRSKMLLLYFNMNHGSAENICLLLPIHHFTLHNYFIVIITFHTHISQLKCYFMYVFQSYNHISFLTRASPWFMS